MTDQDTGRIGEYYVLYKLATLNIHAIKVSDHFSFDLLTKDGKRIEVKTATLQLRKRKYKDRVNTWWDWGFVNRKLSYHSYSNGAARYKYSKLDRKCDYFVCVCLDKTRENIERCYIIPKKIVGNKSGIVVGISDKKHKYDKYLERWDLLECSYKTQKTQEVRK